MKKASTHSLQLVPPLLARAEAPPARRARVERAAAELRAASVSRAPRTSLIDIAWDTGAEAASFPPVVAHRESAPALRAESTATFFHATPAWVGGVPSRSRATSTMPGLGPALLLPPSATRHSSERPLLTALIIAATVMVGFGVGFGTSFGASVGATLMRLSLIAPSTGAQVVRPAVPAQTPLSLAQAAALAPSRLLPPSAAPVDPPPSEVPAAPAEVSPEAPSRAPGVHKTSAGTVSVRSTRTPPTSDNPY